VCCPEGGSRDNGELRAFLELFGDGRFYEAHEVLAAPWRRHRDPLYRGLILLAAAFIQAERGNANGQRKLIHNAGDVLRTCPDHAADLDLLRLRTWLGDALCGTTREIVPPNLSAIQRPSPGGRRSTCEKGDDEVAALPGSG